MGIFQSKDNVNIDDDVDDQIEYTDSQYAHVQTVFQSNQNQKRKSSHLSGILIFIGKVGITSLITSFLVAGTNWLVKDKASSSLPEYKAANGTRIDPLDGVAAAFALLTCLGVWWASRKPVLNSSFKNACRVTMRFVVPFILGLLMPFLVKLVEIKAGLSDPIFSGDNGSRLLEASDVVGIISCAFAFFAIDALIERRWPADPEQRHLLSGGETENHSTQVDEEDQPENTTCCF